MISPFLAHSHTEVQCIGPYASIAAVQSAIPGPDFAPKPACTLSGRAAPPPSCQRPGAAPRGYRDCVALMWDRKHLAEVKRRQEEARLRICEAYRLREGDNCDCTLGGTGQPGQRVTPLTPEEFAPFVSTTYVAMVVLPAVSQPAPRCTRCIIRRFKGSL
jgi:hypothetical protein